MKSRNDEAPSKLASHRPHHHPDWEGFVYDHDVTNNHSLVTPEHGTILEWGTPYKKSTKQAKQPAGQTSNQPTSSQKEDDPLPKLKSKLPVAFVNGYGRSRQHEDRGDLMVRASKKLSTGEKSNRRSLPAQMAPVSERKRLPINPYPRVPIVKVEDKYMNYGTFVYRGMNPRTSDRYFNTLKQVDYMQPVGYGHWKDRLKQPLSFNSKFQSGNLNYAIKTRQNEYDLYIRVDTNTQGHRQWYFFSVTYRKVQGSNSGNVFRFNIFRFAKRQSLYRRGMKPYTFSKMDYQAAVAKCGADQDQQLFRQSWRQEGANVSYTDMWQQEKKNYYALSFTYEFKREGDEIYFAACPPYSYSYLNRKIQLLCSSDQHEITTTNELLSKTICGLQVPLLTVAKANPKKQETSNNYVVIMARTHPGETSGSWVMDGLLQWLRDCDNTASILMRNVTLKLVPMLNPDGVFMGNYRTGIAGFDYNRKFNSGKPSIFPQVEALKKMVDELKKTGRVVAVIDLHGHSILRNSFIFGPASCRDSQLAQFPQELAELSELFKLSSCRFKNEKDKIETARGYYQFRQQLVSFTVENSLGLVERSDGRTYPIGVEDWRNFGADIGRCLSQLLAGAPRFKERSYVSAKLASMIQHSQELSSDRQTRSKSKIEVGKVRPPIGRQRKLSVKGGGEAQIMKRHQQTQSCATGRLITDLNRTTNIEKESSEAGLHQSNLDQLCVRSLRRNTQQPAVEELDGFTDDYDSDDNDQDSEADDLAPELLEPILTAIQTRQFPSETFRATSNIKTNEDLMNEIIQEQSKLQAIFQRNTNGFKQLKFNRKRLSPEPTTQHDIRVRNYNKDATERSNATKQKKEDWQMLNATTTNEIRIQEKAQKAQNRVQQWMKSTNQKLAEELPSQNTLREFSKELRMIKRPRFESSQQYRVAHQASMGSPRPISLEKEVTQQVASERKQLEDKRTSIFNQSRVFAGAPFGRAHASPKSFGFYIKRKL